MSQFFLLCHLFISFLISPFGNTHACGHSRRRVHYTRSLLLFRLRENRSTGNTQPYPYLYLFSCHLSFFPFHACVVIIQPWNVLHVHYTRSLLLFRLRENRSTGNTQPYPYLYLFLCHLSFFPFHACVAGIHAWNVWVGRQAKPHGRHLDPFDPLGYD